MKKQTNDSRAGFSLVELLVVVAVIGLLATIAIAKTAEYRKRGYEATLKSDLRNAATAEDAYFVQTRAYKSGPLSNGTPTGYNKGPDISITSNVSGNAFELTATHSSCTGITWTYNSVTGAVTGPPCP